MEHTGTNSWHCEEDRGKTTMNEEKQNDETVKRPHPLWFIGLPFSFLGFLLYVCIGLPIAGTICGWIVARDKIMGSLPKDKDEK